MHRKRDKAWIVEFLVIHNHISRQTEQSKLISLSWKFQYFAAFVLCDAIFIHGTRFKRWFALSVCVCVIVTITDLIEFTESASVRLKNRKQAPSMTMASTWESPSLFFFFGFFFCYPSSGKILFICTIFSVFFLFVLFNTIHISPFAFCLSSCWNPMKKCTCDEDEVEC